MATNNAIDNTSNPLATSAVTIDPSAASDSYMQFSINTTGEFRMGADNTDSSFRLSQGSALGTNDTMIFTAAGERTLPLQPTFRATPTSTQSSVTGDGTAYTVVFGTEAFDVGGIFDGTSTFTAPVAGIYMVGAYVYGAVATYSSSIVQIDINAGSSYILSEYDPTSFVANVNVIGGGSQLISLAASDAVTVVATVSGGAKTVDISTTHTRFYAYLVA